MNRRRRENKVVAKSATDFIHLHPTGMSPCTLDRTAYATAVETWLCRGCGAPKPSIQAVDVQIQERHPDDVPITFVTGTGLMLVKKEFLGWLGEDRVRADLMLGVVKGASGEVINDWVTARGRKRIIVRGSTNVSHRRCELCGRQVYFAMGARYLYPDPPTSASIFESHVFGLVLLASAFDGAAPGPLRGLGLEKLKVRQQPLDSLGELAES
jgi:hypothetical protein